jgi:hypothetical protein
MHTLSRDLSYVTKCMWILIRRWIWLYVPCWQAWTHVMHVAVGQVFSLEYQTVNQMNIGQLTQRKWMVMDWQAAAVPCSPTEYRTHSTSVVSCTEVKFVYMKGLWLLDAAWFWLALACASTHTMLQVNYLVTRSHKWQLYKTTSRKFYVKSPVIIHNCQLIIIP